MKTELEPAARLVATEDIEKPEGIPPAISLAANAFALTDVVPILSWR